MSSRSVSVTLSANVSGFTAAMGRAAGAVDQVVSKTTESGRRIADVARNNEAEWNTVGTTLTRVGAVAAAGLGVAAKAAIDWESAFAGVKKTVDGTPEQIAALEGELRQMARTMATSHTDIAAVAEAAGQLGVATEDVASFSRTMIMLGETTDLSADQAATSMAQLMTIMGTAPDQVGNLGAALAGLGNNSATTESQILQMSQRIAGAGTAIGLTEADVMGFSAAIASTGIEVEAGGTAISMAMLKMEQAVRAGGAELDILAQTAGMSSAEFKRAFEQDAAGAIVAFVEGLGQVQQSGGDVTAILRDLGITGIREADTLRRLANAGTLLGDSIGLANDEFAAGTALLEEYAQRANTTESKLKVAWNNIVDAAISAGAVMLPVIASMAEAIARFAAFIGDLPPALQGFGVGALAVVAAVGLVGGAVMKTIAVLIELRAALAAVGALTAVQAGLSAFAGGLAAVTRATAPLLIALAAVAVSARAMNQAWKDTDAGYQMTRNLETMTQAILAVSDASKQAPSFDEVFTFSTGIVIKERLTGLDDAMKEINKTGAYQGFAGWAHGLGLATSLAGEAKERFLELDTAMADLTKSGQMREAAAAFDQIAEAGRRAGMSSEQLISLFPAYQEAVRNAGEALAGHNLTAEEMVELMSGRIPPSLREAAQANSDLANELADVAGATDLAILSMQEYANQLLALSGSQIGVEQAIASANEALKENGRNIDLTTEAGRANVTALNNLAASSMKYVETLAEQGASVQEQEEALARARGEFERLATAMGFSEAEVRKMADAFFATQAPSAQAAAAARNFAIEAAAGSQAAKDLADALSGIPPDTQITVTAPGMEPMIGTAEALRDRLNELPPDKTVTVTLPGGQVVTGTVAEIQAGLDGLPANTAVGLTVTGDAEARIHNFSTQLALIPADVPVTVSVDGGPEAEATMGGIKSAIDGVPDDKPVQVYLPDGEVAILTAGEIRTAIENIENKDVLVTVDPSGAIAGAAEGQAAVDATTGKTNPLDVDPSGAIEGSATAQGAVDATTGKTNPVDVDPSGSISGSASAQGAVDATHGKTNPVDVNPAGSIAGASQAQSAVDATRGKTNPVDVDPSGAVAGSRTAQGAIDSTHGVNRDISVSSNAASTAAAAQARMNAVRNVTRYITTIARTMHAGGGSAMMGQFAEGGLIQRLAAGGPVAGWSPHPKADNVTIRATAGEFMQPVATVQTYGLDAMEALRTRRIDPRAFDAFLNAQGLANGGTVQQPVPRTATATLTAPTINITMGTVNVRNDRDIPRLSQDLQQRIDAQQRSMGRG